MKKITQLCTSKTDLASGYNSGDKIPAGVISQVTWNPNTGCDLFQGAPGERRGRPWTWGDVSWQQKASDHMKRLIIQWNVPGWVTNRGLVVVRKGIRGLLIRAKARDHFRAVLTQAPQGWGIWGFITVGVRGVSRFLHFIPRKISKQVVAGTSTRE